MCSQIMETTGLTTYPARKDASWGEAAYLLTWPYPLSCGDSVMGKKF